MAKALAGRFAAGLVAVLALAACAGGGERVDADALPTLVLQPGDLPPAFVRFDDGRVARAEQRAEPGRFGREDGWKSRYRRPGSAETAGALVVESRADVFVDAEGAGKELAAYRAELDEAGEARDLDSLGDGGWAVSTTQPGFPTDVVSHTLAWREANVVASLVVQGFEGKVSLDDALALARKQERRIAAAVS